MAPSTSSESTGRVRLDREMIIDAMVQLAHDYPTKRITVKRLGEALGVDATAMYRHFKNVRELNRAGLDRLLQRVTDESRQGAGTWRERLERHILLTGQISQYHPSIMAEAFTFDPVGAGDLAWIEFVIEMLEQSGLPGNEIVEAYGAISGYTLAHSSAIASDVLNYPATIERGDVKWISSFGSLRLSEYPMVNKYRDELLDLPGGGVFQAGAVAILDAIESRTTAHR